MEFFIHVSPLRLHLGQSFFMLLSYIWIYFSNAPDTQSRVSASGLNKYEEIERLNLTLLTSQASDKDSVSTLTPYTTSVDAAHAESITMSNHGVPMTHLFTECFNMPASDLLSARSEVSTTEVQSVRSENLRVPFQNIEASDNLVQIPCDILDKVTQRGASGDSYGDNRAELVHKWSLVKPSVSKNDSLALMTPADFLRKGVQSEVEINYNMAPRSVTSAYSGGFGDCQSSATTPRILCDNNKHSHPLSETRSFRVNEFSEIQALSTTSSARTPRDQFTSLGFPSEGQVVQTSQEQISSKSRAVTPQIQLSTHNPPSSRQQSSHSIQREIVAIRNKLKAFDQKKRKLR